MNPDLYTLLAARARGRCECGVCNLPVPPGTIDHFFGRAKAEEVEFNCWVLRPACHVAKTDSKPSSAEWTRRFIAHCRRFAVGNNGYVVAIAEAEKRAAWLAARKGAIG